MLENKKKNKRRKKIKEKEKENILKKNYVYRSEKRNLFDTMK